MKYLKKGILVIILISTFNSCCSLLKINCPKQPKAQSAILKESSSFLKTYSYLPFKIPRLGDGVGTLISLDKDKTDNLEMALGICINEKNLDIKSSKGSLPNYTYTLKTKDSILFDPSEILGNNLTLEFIKSKNIADSVVVSFSGIKEYSVSRSLLRKEIKRIVNDKDEHCAKEVSNPNFYLIDRVLSASSFEIKFYNKNKKLLKLDASAKQILKSNIANFIDDNGYSILKSDEERFIGFRPYKVEILPGSGEVDVNFRKVDLEELLRN